MRTFCCSPPDNTPTLASARADAVHRSQQILHQGPLLARPERDTEAAPVYAQFNQVPGPYREVGFEQHLLRYVANGVAAGPASRQLHSAGRDALEAEDGAQQGGLSGAVHPDQPGHLAGGDGKRHVVEDFPAPKPNREPVDDDGGLPGTGGAGHPDGSRPRAGRGQPAGRRHHSLTVEIPLVTASWRASTSASIHDW